MSKPQGKSTTAFREQRKRTEFTVEEKNKLRDYVIKVKNQGKSIHGNTIYIRFAEKNDTHTYQSWRDHAVKKIIPAIEKEDQARLNQINAAKIPDPPKGTSAGAKKTTVKKTVRKDESDDEVILSPIQPKSQKPVELPRSPIISPKGSQKPATQTKKAAQTKPATQKTTAAKKVVPPKAAPPKRPAPAESTQPKKRATRAKKFEEDEDTEDGYREAEESIPKTQADGGELFRNESDEEQVPEDKAEEEEKEEEDEEFTSLDKTILRLLIKYPTFSYNLVHKSLFKCSCIEPLTDELLANNCNPYATNRLRLLCYSDQEDKLVMSDTAFSRKSITKSKGHQSVVFRRNFLENAQ